MNLKHTSRYKTVIYLLFTLLLVTSCSIQQKGISSRQSNPDRAVKHISGYQNSSIRESNPKPLAAVKSEPSRQGIPDAQVKDIEKKLGIAIHKNDPDVLLYIEAAKWVGVGYKYGGMGKSGTDCSGLTYQLYKAVYNKTLRRSSAAMAKYDVKDIAKGALKPGDLIFFATSGGSKAVTHVGVYLKDNRFIHASSKVGVVVNNLNVDYYRKTFVKCGRVE